MGCIKGGEYSLVSYCALAAVAIRHHHTKGALPETRADQRGLPITRFRETRFLTMWLYMLLDGLPKARAFGVLRGVGLECNDIS